ncbi:MAG: flagellar M-ring protein FliF C-terminal domain-containing protein [Candidatus Margulisiibacteriota bacterium]
MAEENPIENEFDDLENQNDIDLPDDELNQDESNINASNDTKPSFIKRLTGIFSALKQNRRYQIIAGFIVIIIIGITTFFAVNKPSGQAQPSSAMTQQEAPTFDSSEIVKKKSAKKKKRKIKYVDLYKQLEGRQLTPILRELSYLNIYFNVVQNGKQFDLQVDEDQVEEAKNILAIKGMPSETAKGYEIFDEASNLGVTEFDKRIRLIRALSGEMEKSIMEFDVVDFAYVEIVIPETRLFAVTQPPVTSSILIKRRNGANINDETVYAIIQLVSNSVENLLPENISVVDTEGRVLSTGVVERMTTKIEEQEMKTKPVMTTVGNGKVIIPAIEDVVDWFQLKFNYETVLEKKAVNQLNGVLPEGAYKTAVTIDLNSVSKTGAPDIKQIVTSVVVDDQFDEVELNDETMNQIKQAVAGAVGYVEDRDKIHISKAAFLPKRQPVDSEDTLDEMQKVVLPQDTFIDKASRILRLWPIFGIGCLITSGVLVIFLFAKSIVLQLASLLGSIGKLFKKKEKEPEPIEDLEPIEEDVQDEPISEQEVINNLKSQSNFGKVIQLKAISTQEIETVVEKLKDMVK